MIKKDFWNSEKILSLSALFISLITLIVFWYQTNLMREQQHMSVYPYLDFNNENGGSLKYKYILKNDGVGPALIDTLIIEAPDGKIYHDFVDYVNASLKPEDSVYFLHSNVNPGMLIPANDKIDIIILLNDDLLRQRGVKEGKTNFKNTITSSVKLYEVLNHDSLKVRLVYKSIYNEKWELVTGVRGSRKVDD